MVTTKKMMADLNKLTGGDKFVCDACGSDKITEKVMGSIKMPSLSSPVLPTSEPKKMKFSNPF